MQSVEEAYFQSKIKTMDPNHIRLQDFLTIASDLRESQRIVTLGEAKDRIVKLTQILARKEYQVLFINKEKEFYRKAFQETHN